MSSMAVDGWGLIGLAACRERLSNGRAGEARLGIGMAQLLMAWGVTTQILKRRQAEKLGNLLKGYPLDQDAIAKAGCV
jgi:hypothetical protein